MHNETNEQKELKRVINRLDELVSRCSTKIDEKKLLQNAVAADQRELTESDFNAVIDNISQQEIDKAIDIDVGVPLDATELNEACRYQSPTLEDLTDAMSESAYFQKHKKQYQLLHSIEDDEWGFASPDPNGENTNPNTKRNYLD